MFASFEWQFRQIISEHAIKVNEEFSKDYSTFVIL